MSEPKLVAMERTAAEKKKAEARYTEASPSGPDYPYGLTINLGKDELDKLGLKELPEVGDELHVYAVCCVTRVSQSADKRGDDSKSVELQITHMGAMDEAKEESEEGSSGFSKAAGTLYGGK